HVAAGRAHPAHHPDPMRDAQRNNVSPHGPCLGCPPNHRPAVFHGRRNDPENCPDSLRSAPDRVQRDAGDYCRAALWGWRAYKLPENSHRWRGGRSARARHAGTSHRSTRFELMVNHVKDIEVTNRAADANSAMPTNGAKPVQLPANQVPRYQSWGRYPKVKEGL